MKHKTFYCWLNLHAQHETHTVVMERLHSSCLVISSTLLVITIKCLETAGGLIWNRHQQRAEASLYFWRHLWVMLENKPNSGTESDPTWLFGLADIHKPHPVALLNTPKHVYQAHLLLPSSLPGSVQISSFYHHSSTSLLLQSVNHPSSSPKWCPRDSHTTSFTNLTLSSSINLSPTHLILELLFIQGWGPLDSR